MLFTLYIDDNAIPINVPDALLHDAGDIFDKMDADMDKGWQMGRTWVDNPDLEQRCQVAAERIVTAYDTDNQKMGMMMAGYIMARAPLIRVARVPTNGEIQDIELLTSAEPF
jgi:hypothetical protein